MTDVIVILIELFVLPIASIFEDTFGTYVTILYGVIAVVLFYLFQVFCCFKLKKTALRFIPIYLITPYSISFLIGLLSAAINDKGGFFAGPDIFFVFLFPPLAFALLGIGFGWLTYKSVIKRRKLRLEAKK
jgi:hypothetical protein